ncbi:MAG: hypothetical protein K9M15_00590 [Candidatus Marinimicrobia bacterium]|nr:hypothetical protein [Candidatus Neomarinimicrobiota bacterium]
MEKWKVDIANEFDDCMKMFPELGDIILVIKESEELSGGAGRVVSSGKEAVILSVPLQLRVHPKALRPLIFHELSHKIDLENPDKVFRERADEGSRKMWQLLQKNGMVKCIVEDKDNLPIEKGEIYEKT